MYLTLPSVKFGYVKLQYPEIELSKKIMKLYQVSFVILIVWNEYILQSLCRMSKRIAYIYVKYL